MDFRVMGLGLSWLLDAQKEDLKRVLGMNGDYLFKNKKSPVCLVAHVDTVFDEGKREIALQDTAEGLVYHTTNNTPLGADDRAGVFALMQLEREFPDISILYTDYEECGAAGARAFVEEWANNVPEIKLFIEIDRQGNKHFVNYDPIPETLKTYLKKEVGLKEDWGTFSDISIITKATDVPSINLACGYYNQHSSREILKVNELLTCIKDCKKIISDVKLGNVIL